MAKDLNLVGQDRVNGLLKAYFASGSELKSHLLRQFGSYGAVARAAGWEECRVHQICSGYKVPSGTDLIKKLADAWHIDIVVLTTLFSKLRRESK